MDNKQDKYNVFLQKHDEKPQLWIVAINNSNDDGIKLTKKMATKTEVQKYILDLALKDRENDIDTFCYGTKELEQVVENEYNTEFLAYCSFQDYQIDYIAKLFDSIEFDK